MTNYAPAPNATSYTFTRQEAQDTFAEAVARGEGVALDGDADREPMFGRWICGRDDYFAVYYRGGADGEMVPTGRLVGVGEIAPGEWRAVGLDQLLI